MLVSFQPNVVTKKYQTNKANSCNVPFRQNALQVALEDIDTAWLAKIAKDSDEAEIYRFAFITRGSNIALNKFVATLTEAKEKAPEGVAKFLESRINWTIKWAKENGRA